VPTFDDSHKYVSNIRTTIRNNVRTALLANSSVTALVADRVTIGRDNVTGSDDWPAIYIVPIRDETNTHTMSVARQQRRKMILGIEYWAKVALDATPVEDDIDTGADAIATAVLADTTQDGSCADSVLTSLDYMVEGREELRFGRGLITFEITYFTRES
jgi:hypothetical protein